MCFILQYQIIKLEQFFTHRFIQPNANLTLQFVATSLGLESYILLDNAFPLVNISFRVKCFSENSFILAPAVTFKNKHYILHQWNSQRSHSNPCEITKNEPLCSLHFKDVSLVFLACIMNSVFCEQYEMICSYCVMFS